MFKVYARLFAACFRGNCESHSLVEHSEQDASPLQSRTRQFLSDWSDVWQISPERLEEMQRERERHGQAGTRLQNLVLNALHDSSYRSDNNHIVSDSGSASSSHSGHNGHARNRRVTIDGSRRTHNTRPSDKRRVTIDGSRRTHNTRPSDKRQVTIDGSYRQPEAVLENPFRDTYGRICQRSSSND
eukprot:2261184-Pyramimonas_sp.AAC.1